jgi:deoxycytidine triphosphate deaminase
MRKLREQDGPNGLLGRAAIASRVAAGEVIAASTFSEENLRGAGYDLRIARDMLVTPDGRRYGPDEKDAVLEGPIILNSGETAFVTTLENIHLPWDIAANIAPKYSFARHGLLVFSGVIVDPGYGMTSDDPLKDWRPRANERLHFLITNLSNARKELFPVTQSIAALQFFQVDPVPRPARKEVAGAVAVWREVRESGRAPIESLGLFSEGRHELDELKLGIRTANATTDRVVVFGLYVLAAALLGMVVTALVAILDNPHHVITLKLQGGFSEWSAYLFLAVAFALAFVVVVSPVYLIRGLWGGLPRITVRRSRKS